MEADLAGERILEAISNADRFNRWMYDTIRPFVKGPLIEIGSGIGNLSALLLNSGLEIRLTDIRPAYCQRLAERFTSSTGLTGIEVMDIADPAFASRHSARLGYYRTALALNVIEHIGDDRLALRNCRSLLRKGGRLIVLVPSYPSLYNRFDEVLGHCRRYTMSSLGEALRESGFKIVHKQHFNLAGIPGWYLNGSILGSNTIPSLQLRIFDRLVPLFRQMDRITRHSAGLSTIMVGEKP